jgi:hypothetical protein
MDAIGGFAVRLQLGVLSQIIDGRRSTLSVLSHRSEADIAGSKALRPIKNRPRVQPRAGMLEDLVESSSAPEPRVLPSPSMLPISINIRSTSLAVLAVIAVIGLLFFARAVFIPITIAVLASYALTPLVDGLRKKTSVPKPRRGRTDTGLAPDQPWPWPWARVASARGVSSPRHGATRHREDHHGVAAKCAAAARGGRKNAKSCN